MNPAILGALIGAIPGTLAAGLTTWASMQSSRASQEQTRLTLEADYDRWLRERRADISVEVSNFALKVEERIRRLVWTNNAMSDEIRHQFQEAYDIYDLPETHQLLASTAAFSSTEALKAFVAMREADRALWTAVMEDNNDEVLTVDKELQLKKDKARDAADALINAARRDLQK